MWKSVAKEDKNDVPAKFAVSSQRGSAAGFVWVICAMALVAALHLCLGPQQGFWPDVGAKQGWNFTAFDAFQAPYTLSQLAVTLLPLAVMAASLRRGARFLRLSLAWALLLCATGGAYIFISSEFVPSRFVPDRQLVCGVMAGSALSLVVIGHRAKRLRWQGAFFAIMMAALALQLTLKALGATSPLLGLVLPVVHADLGIDLPWVLWSLGLLSLLLCGKHRFALLDRRWRKAVRP